MKITRRMVDPITFVERVGVEFIPRLEDSVLDDQLAESMSYIAPKTSLRPPAPPPVDPSTPASFRPPTPPKSRGKGDNNPRARVSSQSPGGPKKRLSASNMAALLNSSGGSLVSPRRSRKSLAQIGEDLELSETSLSDLSGLQGLNGKEEQAQLEKQVRFEDEVQLNEISKLRRSMLEDMFYASEDLANFRYEAFMEELGLDMDEFD